MWELWFTGWDAKKLPHGAHGSCRPQALERILEVVFLSILFTSPALMSAFWVCESQALNLNQSTALCSASWNGPPIFTICDFIYIAFFSGLERIYKKKCHFSLPLSSSRFTRERACLSSAFKSILVEKFNFNQRVFCRTHLFFLIMCWLSECIWKINSPFNAEEKDRHCSSTKTHLVSWRPHRPRRRTEGELGALLVLFLERAFNQRAPRCLYQVSARSCCRCRNLTNETGNGGHGVSVGNLVLTALLGFPFEPVLEGWMSADRRARDRPY